MALTENTYTGDGSTVLFSFTFPYLETTDIKVSLNGTITTAYTLANATTIQFNTAPANGVAIWIYRNTLIDSIDSTFFPGSAIRAQDLNNNFTQNLYVTQESNREAATAITTAQGAVTTANSAASTANAATATANTAVSTANTASTNASAAVTTANTASTNASAAVSTANTASTNAATALTTANSAAADAATAISTANSAVSTANSAVSTANAATTTAGNAVSTANSAVSTANTASTTASNAVTTANAASATAAGAVTTANSAVSTATGAVTTANTALSTANAAASAVANAILYDTVANVAAIPASPANNDAVEVTDSTGIESFTPLSGVPAGFVGDSGLSVRIVYLSGIASWSWIQYFPNDPENRYGDAISVLQANSLSGSDIGVTVQAYDADTAKLDAIQTFSAAQEFEAGLTLNSQSELRLADSDSSNWVALQAPATVGSNVTWTLPDSDGSSGQVLNTNGAGVLSWAAAGGIATLDEFASSGTWNKPASAQFVLVEAWGAGGGGGSGARRALTSLTHGGSGGSGGALVSKVYKASDLPSSVSVTIGAGGVGASAITANDTNGNAGTNGGNSTFGSLLTAYGGSGGTGGTSTSPTLGVGGAGVVGRNSGTVGGGPILYDNGNAALYSGVSGGGSASLTSGTAYGSTYGGGAGGGSSSGNNYSGGTSVYAGAGGSSGGGLDANALNNYDNSVAAAAYFGTGGTSGNQELAASSAVAWSGITYGDGKYIVYGSGQFATSTTGTASWVSSPYYSLIASATPIYGDGLWVGYANKNLYQSDDFITRTLAVVFEQNVQALAYHSGTYVAVGALGYIATSTDLVTWTTRTSGTTRGLGNVLYDGTQWLIVGEDTYTAVLTSTDAVTWTKVSESSSLITRNAKSIATNGSTIVVANQYNTYLSYSTDGGATFTNTGSTVSPNTTYHQLAYGNGVFVYIDGNTGIYSSTNGQTWTSRTNPSGDTLRGIIYDNGLFFIGSGTSNSNAGLSSTDGITWTTRTFTPDSSVLAGDGGNGFIACGGGGGGASHNGNDSGAGGNGGAGFCRVYTW